MGQNEVSVLRARLLIRELFVMISEPPNDAQIRETLVANESRYGLLTSFVSSGGSPHLAIARLVEVRRGHPLRMLGRWKFEGDTNHLPTAADVSKSSLVPYPS